MPQLAKLKNREKSWGIDNVEAKRETVATRTNLSLRSCVFEEIASAMAKHPPSSRPCSMLTFYRIYTQASAVQQALLDASILHDTQA